MLGINAVRILKKEKSIVFSKETMIGALAEYILEPNENFQPMNSNFGILPKIDEEIKDKKLKYEKLAKRSLDNITTMLQNY